MTPVGGHKIEPVTPCCNEQSIELCAKCASSLSLIRLFVTLWTVACQAPLSMGILQARVLQWVIMPSSMESSQPRDRTQVSHIAGRFFSVWATGEAQSYCMAESKGSPGLNPLGPFGIILIYSFFFYFNVNHFLSLYWICCNPVSAFCFGFLTMRPVGS